MRVMLHLPLEWGRQLQLSWLCGDAGGVYGLYSALTDGTLSAFSEAVAQGNGLGKGPLVFELYRSGVDLIRQSAAGEGCQ